jgi:hypothetical protein
MIRNTKSLGSGSWGFIFLMIFRGGILFVSVSVAQNQRTVSSKGEKGKGERKPNEGDGGIFEKSRADIWHSEGRPKEKTKKKDQKKNHRVKNRKGMRKKEKQPVPFSAVALPLRHIPSRLYLVSHIVSDLVLR